MLFNLDFVNNTIFSCFFFFCLIIDLQFLIPAVVAEIFNSVAELVISVGITSKEAKKEMKIDSVTAEAKIRNCLI